MKEYFEREKKTSIRRPPQGKIAKIIGNLQGFCQYIMADMLNLTIADYRKYSALVFLGP